MNDLVLAALAMTVGIGIVVTVAGLTGRRIFGRSASGRSLPIPTDRLILRIALASGGAILVLLGTGWIVGGVIAGVGGFAIPGLLGANGRHHHEIEHIEAIASWTEQLRDTLAAANGLEHAVSASAHVAPAAISGAVERLATRIEYESLADALLPFADELDHPLADFVVAAIRVAAEREARELGPLLGHLAECARDEARMRMRVWVGRARMRTTVRVVGIVIGVSLVGLYALDRDYLAAYDGFSGQIALLIVALMFALSIVLLERMGRIAMPARFVGRRLNGRAAS